jgi:hypothetical protein
VKIMWEADDLSFEIFFLYFWSLSSHVPYSYLSHIFLQIFKELYWWFPLHSTCLNLSRVSPQFIFRHIKYQLYCLYKTRLQQHLFWHMMLPFIYFKCWGLVHQPPHPSESWTMRVQHGRSYNCKTEWVTFQL